MSGKKTTKTTAKKPAAKKPAAKRTSKKPYTHIDRSNGTLLREADLNKDKPHISPISNQASVEKLNMGEYEAANG